MTTIRNPVSPFKNVVVDFDNLAKDYFRSWPPLTLTEYLGVETPLIGTSSQNCICPCPVSDAIGTTNRPCWPTLFLN